MPAYESGPQARGALLALSLALAALSCDAQPSCHGCNVVLISLDTLRADRLGAYGHHRETSPALDAFAEQSFLFTDAIAQAPHTLPSHRSLFSGRYPLGPFEGPTLAELLRSRGYHTAAFTGGGYVHSRFGFARGFDLYLDGPRRETLAWRAERMFEWLSQPGHRPFFVFLHTYDVHCPYTPPAPYQNMFAGAYRPAFSLQGKCGGKFFNKIPLSGDDLDYLSAAYDGGVRWVDDAFAEIVAEFERRGLEQDTIFVITSDHGESLGENGFVGHAHLSREELRVPLLLRVPGAAPRRIDTPVQLVDVLPTLMDLLGFPPPPGIDGLDVAPLLASEKTPRDPRTRLAVNPKRDYALIEDDWMLFSNARAERRELYRWPDALSKDVLARHPERAEALEGRLRRIIERGGVGSSPYADDEELQQQLRELGYLE